MFLKISIYASATFDAKILDDRRVTPTKKPITVAKKYLFLKLKEY